MTVEEELLNEYNLAFNLVLERLLKQKSFTERDRALLADFDKIMTNLENKTAAYTQDRISQLYTANRVAVLNALEIVAIPAITAVDSRAVEEIQRLFFETMQDGIEQVRGNINAVVKKLATAQKLSGGSTKELAAKFVDIMTSQGIFVFEDKAGRAYNLTSYAKMAINTAATRAVNKSTFSASQTINNDLVKMSSHLSSCPICAMYEGRVYSISGKDKKYPPLSIINNGAVVQFGTIHQ